ncbi:MAG TPA: DUF6512 family protein [Thermoclostridium sp.]|nr:DUF6512 family protein [Thermoclostridium sp.]
MRKTCILTTKKIFLFTILLGIIAVISHYAYELSGEILFVGLFNPVNESVWEHLKFMFFPLLLWWVAMYLIKSDECVKSTNTWIVSAAASLVVAPLSVLLLYYGCKGALGLESVFFDILLVFICYFFTLCIASRIFMCSNPKSWVSAVLVVIVLVIFIAFIVFTFNPPQFPIFCSNQ